MEAAIAHAMRLLAANPRAAEEQAHEILRVAPGHPGGVLAQGAARRALGDYAGAAAILGPLADAQPRAAEAQYEHALALSGLGRTQEAIAALRRAVALKPLHPHAWRALGDALSLAGENEAAEQAYARHIRAGVSDPSLVEAAAALCDNRLAIAERLLRAHLKRHPTDVAAMRMLAETGARLTQYDDAEALLERCLALAPSFTAARHNYASILHRQNKALEAIAQADVLLADTPLDPGLRGLKAAALARLGAYEEAAGLYEAVLRTHPEQPRLWMSYGHALKTLGRQEECVTAYRRAIALRPDLGEAYWSLANLKTVRFTPEDVAAMEAELLREDLTGEDRFHLHFALGKALEDAGDYERSFTHYRTGAALRRRGIGYDPDRTRANVDRAIALFSRDFLTARAGQGCPDPDPIFILGLPRAGSTLLEQILASHSLVEGTMELPDIIAIAKRLSGRVKRSDPSAYPEILARLSGDELSALGREYLDRTRIQRRTDKPFFIDKMPNNWLHIGLITLALPNAKIIDARRHPLGCCFSAFKQHFARGQNFSYDLADLGRYYSDYVRLTAHFDAVVPGRVHRVIYEQVVEDAEGEVRALLTYCGLPFEERCLRFHETDRAVRTASSEQVRKPIFTDAVEHWRHYEPWLGPLKDALGPVLGAYPDAPNF